MQNILVTGLLAVWLFISVVFLISMVQGVINDQKREARSIEREKRELQYHEARMKEIEKWGK